MKTWLFWSVLVVLTEAVALFLCLTAIAGCSFSPPPNTGAYGRGLTETKESKARPAPVAVPQSYPYYTNAADDRLVESHTIQPPPSPPGHGPVPVFVAAPAVSNMFTAKVLPKLLVTNQVPGSVILTKITTTDSSGKKFSAELELLGEQRIQANDKMAVVIFAVAYTNYSIQVCTNLTEGKWTALSSGVSQNTNGAIVIVDLDQGTHPLKFYRQVKAAP